MFGRRSDGYLIKNIDPIVALMPHIMSERNDAMVQLQYEIDYGKLARYVVRKEQEGVKLTFMDVVIMKRDFLREIVDKAVAHGLHNVDRDLILRMVQEKQAKINACEYKGLCWHIDSVQAFFQFNMDILQPDKRAGVFRDDLPVYTKVRDEMPAYYGDEANVVNSLVADGCQIEGTVENSILFRGVKIAPNAHVKNCIIMQDGLVHEGAYIENCIMDKQSVIKRGAKLIGPAAYPIVIAKNVVI